MRDTHGIDNTNPLPSDVLVNLTTGPGARFIPGVDDPLKPGAGSTLTLPAERVRHVLELMPEICSLDMGSMNMGDQVFVNTPAHLEAMAVAIRDASVTPTNCQGCDGRTRS